MKSFYILLIIGTMSTPVEASEYTTRASTKRKGIVSTVVQKTKIRKNAAREPENYDNITQQIITALNNRDEKIVEDLLQGYPPSELNRLRNIQGAPHAMTLLMYAVYTGNTDGVRILLQEGADVAVRNNIGWTALIYAVAGIGSKAAIITLLLNKEKNGIDYQDMQGCTPLINAIKRGNIPAIVTLVEEGADPQYMNSYENKTAFDYAQGNEEILDAIETGLTGRNDEFHAQAADDIILDLRNIIEKYNMPEVPVASPKSPNVDQLFSPLPRNDESDEEGENAQLDDKVVMNLSPDRTA